jgi:hypothetical protein
MRHVALWQVGARLPTVFVGPFGATLPFGFGVTFPGQQSSKVAC